VPSATGRVFSAWREGLQMAHHRSHGRSEMANSSASTLSKKDIACLRLPTFGLALTEPGASAGVAGRSLIGSATPLR
jgi:hypothetical protein